MNEPTERPLRIVFVCTHNKLRSPTAETVFRDVPGWEVASAGMDRRAETPLTRDLLEWADVAVCMQKRHRDWGCVPASKIDALPGSRMLLVALLGRLVPGRLNGVKPR